MFDLTHNLKNEKFAFYKWPKILWTYPFTDFRIYFEQNDELRFFYIRAFNQKLIVRVLIVLFFTFAIVAIYSIFAKWQLVKLETDREHAYTERNQILDAMTAILGEDIQQIDDLSDQSKVIDFVKKYQIKKDKLDKLSEFSIKQLNQANRLLEMSIKISGVKPAELTELKKSFATQRIPSGGPDNGYDSIEMSDKTNKAYKALLIENFSLNQLLSAFPKDNPARYAFKSSLYGIRIHPVTKNLNLHEGDDYVPTLDTKAYATMAGRVTEVGYDQGYGNYVIIDHGHNIKTRYAHLANSTVRLNQEIKKADVIGEIGSTGLSTGNHLHYEIMLNNNKINPSIIMALAKNV